MRFLCSVLCFCTAVCACLTCVGRCALSHAASVGTVDSIDDLFKNNGRDGAGTRSLVASLWCPLCACLSSLSSVFPRVRCVQGRRGGELLPPGLHVAHDLRPGVLRRGDDASWWVPVRPALNVCMCTAWLLPPPSLTCGVVSAASVCNVCAWHASRVAVRFRQVRHRVPRESSTVRRYDCCGNSDEQDGSSSAQGRHMPTAAAGGCDGCGWRKR